jgi:predicted enzyme related to lactoylglutathione lyase
VSGQPIVHLEFATQDPQTTGKFYVDLCGWRLNLAEQFDYLMFEAGSGPGGAFVKAGDAQMRPDEVRVYIGTDDIDGMLRRAEELGGKILMPKSEIPGTGWFGIFSDPDGRQVGLYTNMEG